MARLRRLAAGDAGINEGPEETHWVGAIKTPPQEPFVMHPYCPTMLARLGTKREMFRVLLWQHHDDILDFTAKGRNSGV